VDLSLLACADLEGLFHHNQHTQVQSQQRHTSDGGHDLTPALMTDCTILNSTDMEMNNQIRALTHVAMPVQYVSHGLSISVQLGAQQVSEATTT